MDGGPGRISVRLAMSLDGYIADEDGGYDWIQPVPSPHLDTEHQIPFDDFLETVDLVVMGRHCYDEGAAADHVERGTPVLVATSRPRADVDGITFTHDPVGVVTAARDLGEHCLLFGGGELVQSFLAEDAVDELTIGIVPVLLGGGRPLFPGRYAPIELRLVDLTVADGKTRLVLRRRVPR